jgi:hypothetical protein
MTIRESESWGASIGYLARPAGSRNGKLTPKRERSSEKRFVSGQYSEMQADREQAALVVDQYVDAVKRCRDHDKQPKQLPILLENVPDHAVPAFLTFGVTSRAR